MDLWTDCVDISPFGRLSRPVSAAPDSVTFLDLPSLSGHDHGWMDCVDVSPPANAYFVRSNSNVKFRFYQINNLSPTWMVRSSNNWSDSVDSQAFL